MRTGVFGGAFDPPHAGHREAARAFLSSGEIDRLLIVPSFQAPHKHRHQTGFEHRAAMCRLTFDGISAEIEVSMIERELPVPNFTIRTLEALQTRFPVDELVLCMGADSLAGLHTWKEHKKLLQDFRILVASRPGFDSPAFSLLSEGRVSLVYNTLKPESSTAVRANLAEAIKTCAVLPEVAAYIAANQLYR
jgi:nicotinate-nucleotide adenylyltransferase